MNKMKIYITVMGLLFFTSCGENFLDSEPYTQLTDVNFYKNPQEASAAVVGAYDGLQYMYSSAFSMVVASEIFSDDAFGGGGKSDGYGTQLLDEFDQTRSPGDRDILIDNWGNYYKGIYRCNVVLQNLDRVPWGDQEALRNQLTAELKFLRAIAYFDLVRLFGNVVLQTEPSAENLPQSNSDDVYKQIAEDLVFAIENLPATPYASQAASDHGRATKWAAEALLARVFLYYTGRYQQTDLVGVTNKQQVLVYLEDLIQNSGHALVPDFASLFPAASMSEGFTYAGERNPENVFNVKFTFTSNYNGDLDGNHWMVMMGIRGGNYPPYGLGWGAATVNPALWDAYSDSDTRKTSTIVSVAEEVEGYDNSDQREFTGYYNKKYTPMSDEDGSLAEQLGGVNFMIGQYQDYVMIRYSDVLLMAAELGSPKAQDYFDAVRQRAYKDSFEPLTVNQTNIMNERRLEFAFEGIRYWDLLRQGVDVAADAIAVSATVVNGGVVTSKEISASRIQATQGLQQIPNNQITLSDGVLKQNEGWK